MNISDKETVASEEFMAESKPLPYNRIGIYKLVKHLGDGGMGQVFLAQHIHIKRPCALKFLPPQLSKQATFRRRFLAEVQVLGRLDHPNIVRLFNFRDINVTDSQTEYILEMEFVEGGDLEEKIRSHKMGLSPIETKQILREMLHALVYAHEKTILHRDLKPANILIRKDGGIKISDFGLASVLGSDYQKSLIEKSITLSNIGGYSPGSGAGNIAGTITYMSPQSLKGEKPDLRDDIYALGIITYYMLTGKHPNVNYKPVTKVKKGIDRRWNAFIGRCIEEEREDRFPDAASVLEALEKLNHKRRIFPTVIASGLLAVVLAGAVYLSWDAMESRLPEPVRDKIAEIVTGVTPPAIVKSDRVLPPPPPVPTLSPQSIAITLPGGLVMDFIMVQPDTFWMGSPPR